MRWRSVTCIGVLALVATSLVAPAADATTTAAQVKPTAASATPSPVPGSVSAHPATAALLAPKTPVASARLLGGQLPKGLSGIARQHPTAARPDRSTKKAPSLITPTHRTAPESPFLSEISGHAKLVVSKVLAHASAPAHRSGVTAQPSISSPSAPLDLQVTAGTGATALSWRAPTSDGGSPIQSYLVQVYGTNVPAPMTITCSSGPCTSDEIAGLSNGLSYTFEVSAYNGIAYGPGAFASATVPAITSDTGPYDLITHQLAPGASVGINLANGDVVMSSTDLSIAGVGIPLAITRTYNSQASSLGNTSGAFGENNSSSVGPDVSLAIASGGAVAYHAPDGSIQVFAPAGTGQYFSPPDLSAVLTQSPGGAYTLTDEPSGTELHFDASGRLTSETDRNGNAIRFAYNPGGTLASVTDTQGRVLTVAEAGGRITSITDPSGRTLAYAYDSSGDLTSFTDPMSHVWTYGYSAPGVLGSITDPDGSVTSISYAGSGVASSITYGAGSASAGTTRFAYYLGGASQCLDSTIEACTTITDADAHSSTYYFDPAGRASMSVDANGNQRTGTYDPYSNITSLTDAMVSGNAAAFYYADGAAPKAITTAYGPSPDHHISGQSDTYAYGDSSLPYLPTATTDAQGNTTNYTYDSLGNVIAITDAASNVSSYGLQGSNASCGARSGEICYSTTPAGNETTYAYDASGNQTAVHPPSPLGATNATYDALGRPVTVTQGNGTFVGLQA